MKPMQARDRLEALVLSRLMDVRDGSDGQDAAFNFVVET